MEHLEALKTAADTLTKTPLPEDPDLLGRLDRIIRDLTDYKRAMMAEMEPATGEEYALVERNKAKRYYNTAALIHHLDAAGFSLPDLIKADVARLSWHWTKLKTTAAFADVDLHITHREIEDTGEIDGPLVGEVWESYTVIEGVKE